MSKTHTPGPWKIFKIGSSIGIVPVNSSGKPRAGIHTPDICSLDAYDDGEANAVLIQAAPNMLEALYVAEHALGMARENAANTGGQKCEEAKFFDAPLRTVRTAIAKARGK